MQQAGKHTDMIIAYSWDYWYVSVPLSIILFYLFIRMWNLYGVRD